MTSAQRKLILMCLVLPLLLSEALSAPPIRQRKRDPEAAKAREQKIVERLVKNQIVVKYDRFKRYFVVSFPGSASASVFRLRSSLIPNWSLKVRGSVIIQPQKDRDPVVSHIRLTFISASASWWFLEYHDLDMLLDGKPLDLGELSHDGTVITGGVIETMGVSMPLETFKEIAYSEVVEGRIGSSEFKFKPRLLAILKAFAAKISSPQEIIDGAAHLIP